MRDAVMPDFPTPDALARQMLAAQDEVRQIEPFTARVPNFDLTAGYEVSHRIHEARLRGGAVPVGRKIGFTNPEMWALYGVREPVWAYLYDCSVDRLVNAEAVCALDRYTEPKIEPEIVLHFAVAPPPGGDVAAVVGCIDWVAFGFEIVQSHFPGWRFRAADTVADRALHARLLIGKPQPLERLAADPVEALRDFTVALSCDGRPREVGRGANVLGSPLAAVAHLLGVLAAQPQYAPLQAGELVTTGTLTTAHPVRAGESWQGELQGIDLSGLAVRFV
jgi:2-keto-4-pentenoate hydratase